MDTAIALFIRQLPKVVDVDGLAFPDQLVWLSYNAEEFHVEIMAGTGTQHC